MRTELLIDSSGRPSAAWSAQRDLAEGGVHVSDPWIAYRAAMGNAPRYLLAGDVAAVAYEKRPRFRPWKKSHVFLDRAPEGVAAMLVPVAREHGWAELRVDSFDGPFGARELDGFDTVERHEFLLDLSEDRMAACKSSHRRKIRKAEKSGVVVAEETCADSVRLLYTLQGHTQTRRATRGEDMSLPSPAQYDVLAKTFVQQGGGRLIVARIDGNPVSCILIGVGGPRAYYMMGGTSPEGLASNAASLVMWRAIELLQRDKLQVLNLGGVSARAADPESVEHGLYRFKDGWGGERVSCISGVWRP